MGNRLKLAAATIHRGEEPPISGTRGSATFFFSGCPLDCTYCQNFPISQLRNGAHTTPEDLAARMVNLQTRGAHNINLVTGTQWTPEIVEAVRLARGDGLRVPVVWNTSGYESPETLAMLEGTVDIYLTDLRYADKKISLELSGVSDYSQVARESAETMLAQVGHLQTDENGIGTRGLIVRHLVLPGGLSGTKEILSFIKERLGGQTHLSFMCQYFPAHRAHGHPIIGRPLREEEYDDALRLLADSGIENGWRQEMEARGGS